MSGQRNAFAVVARTSARRVVAEPGGLVMALGYYVIVTAVVTSLWRAAADAGGGEVAGYTAVALTWYLATSEAVTISLNYRLIQEVGQHIGSGDVSVELLRPVSVLGVRVATEIGRVAPRLVGCSLLGVVIASITGGAPPRPAALVLAVPSMFLAVACNIVGQHAFAAAAFWLRDAGAAWFLYQKLVFVVGGMLIPLEALPTAVGDVARLLPFAAMAYAPARLASGHVEPQLLLLQAGWLVVLYGLAAVVFGAGERRLQVVGG